MRSRAEPTDAVIAFKIDTAPTVVGNAIERFSRQPETMTDFVHTVFAGHLRAIIGGMTGEEVTVGRDGLARLVSEASGQEMSDLGLKIDSVQIRDVEDAAGGQFLQAWRQREQAKVIEAGTRNAQLEAAQKEQQMQVDVIKPAEAERDAAVRRADGAAQSLVLAAKADREKTQLDAEAAQIRVELAAIADASRVRADGEARAGALEQNSDAVLQQILAEKMPEIVRAAAEPIAAAGQINLLDVRSLQGMAGGNVAAALAMLPMVVNGRRDLVADQATSGDSPAAETA